MAVSRTPPPRPDYLPDFADAAAYALARLDECTRLEDREPVQFEAGGWLNPAWTTWHDQLHEWRAGLARAVQALLDHHDYEAAHRRQWHDAITVRSTARVAWAPVARRVLRDMATARMMASA